MGAVTDIVRRYVPASYRAMIGVTNSYYTISDLQALADFVQFRTFSTVVGSTLEASLYDLEHQTLLGMLTTLQFIPAAVDFWSDQLQTESTTGTNEVISYFDRRGDLWKLFDRLKEDSTQLAIELGAPINVARGVIPRVSYGDGGRGILVTPDPEKFPKQSRRWFTPDDIFMERSDQV